MGFIAWLIIGGIVGGLASLFMQRDAQEGIFLDVVVGIVGAVLASWTFASLQGAGTMYDRITIPSMLVSMLGAVVLLAIIHLLTRGRAQ